MILQCHEPVVQAEDVSRCSVVDGQGAVGGKMAPVSFVAILLPFYLRGFLQVPHEGEDRVEGDVDGSVLDDVEMVDAPACRHTLRDGSAGDLPLIIRVHGSEALSDPGGDPADRDPPEK